MEEKQTSCCSIFLITAVEKQFTIGNRTFQQTKSLSAVIKRSLHKICFIDQFKKITARPTLLHAAFFVVSSQCTFFTNTPLIMEFLFLMKVVKSCIIYKQGGIKTGFVIWNGTCGSNVTLEKNISHTSISAVEFLMSSELSLKACTYTGKRYGSLYFFYNDVIPSYSL